LSRIDVEGITGNDYAGVWRLNPVVPSWRAGRLVKARGIISVYRIDRVVIAKEEIDFKFAPALRVAEEGNV